MNSKVVKKSGQARAAKRVGHQDVKVRGLTVIGKKWYFRPQQRDGVRPPRVALGTGSYERAVELAMEILGKPESLYTPGTLACELALFASKRRAILVKPLSRRTMDHSDVVLEGFERFIGADQPVASINKKRLEAWRDELLGRGLKGSSVHAYMIRVRAFFTWMCKERGLRIHPVKELEMPWRGESLRDRFCTKEQRELLLGKCGHEDLRLILMLGFFAGMRISEIIEARVDWLYFWEGGGEVRIKKTDTFTPKNRKERKIPMNDRLLKYLREREFKGLYLVRDDLRRKEKKDRYNPKKLMLNLREEVGLEWVGWHTMRHTFATLLVMGGCPIATVAQWLGDGIKVTFDHYVGYSPQKDHINAAL